ncbi:disks large-associated protein 5, partial [Sigmodon hispidus]
FKQFEGLVDNYEYKQGEKETTCSDLDGFWDMVHFQVDDVKQKFNNLIKLEVAEWSSRVEDTSSHGEQDSSAIDQPALSNASPCTQVETSQQYHARHDSFGGDLTVFSPETLK